jgi:hypothetical protein
VNGEVHGANAASSIRHSRRAPGPASNVNVGVASAVTPVGPSPMLVAGAVVSIVNVRVTGDGSAFPAASTARTANVWSPSASASSVTGDWHAVNAAPSSEHSNVVPGSPAANANVGVALPVSAGGAAMICVVGLWVSTRNE